MSARIWTVNLTGRDANGFYGVQRSGYGGERLTPDRLSHSYGFIGRCRDPDANGNGCNVLYLDAGTRENYAWLLNDDRDALIVPPVKPGGSAQYAADGAFASFDPDTHTWTLYVPYANGKAHLVTVGKDGNGTPIVELSSGEGPAITILDKVITTKNASGSAYAVLDDAGHSFVGPFKAAGGADLGGPTSEPLTKFAATTTELTALQSALTAVGAALTGITSILANAAAAPATAAAVTAIATAQSALATFTAAAPTLTTKGA